MTWGCAERGRLGLGKPTEFMAAAKKKQNEVDAKAAAQRAKEAKPFPPMPKRYVPSAKFVSSLYHVPQGQIRASGHVRNKPTVTQA